MSTLDDDLYANYYQKDKNILAASIQPAPNELVPRILAENNSKEV